MFDDLDYLSESKFFHTNIGTLFDLNGLDEDLFLNNDSRREKPPLTLGEKINERPAVADFDNS